ncbi:MAG: chemotaxis protein CheW [Tepidisphaeraceae bacterium]
MTQTPSSARAATGESKAAGKYLTFAIGDEDFGLEILKVREIFGMMPITAVPRMPKHVKGVINLRGQVIAVVSLRTKFGMPEIPSTDQTCIIVVEHANDGRKVDTGIIVDRVSEVLSIAESQIEPPPDLGNGTEAAFITGMGKVGKSVKILLDIDKLLAGQEDLTLPATLANAA